jgi:REP element-mobilizing transposase RayT
MVSRNGCYHVINRGNFRRFIFETEGAREAFRKVLGESCERFGWEVQAFCLMGNHFHLCLSTPDGNLSEGMGWLQGTFAARFNRFRREQGRLFQGRFKSLLVEPGTHLLALVDYIHLNPVRAGLVEAQQLSGYRWSSLFEFPRTRSRPGWLDASWMDYAEGLSDTRSGWNRYRAALAQRDVSDPGESEVLNRQMTRGWCIGSKSFKKACSFDLFRQPGVIRLEGDELREFNQMGWEEALRRSLKTLRINPTELRSMRKSDRRKVAIAAQMKSTTSVTNGWLSENLHMGKPNAVSDYCGKYVRMLSENCPLAKKLRTER